MLVNIACIQMNSQAVVKENLAKAQQFILQATEEDAQLVILPEMFALMSMDQSQKIKEAEPLGSGMIQDFLQEQAAKQKVWLVGGTIPIINPNHRDKVYAAVLIYNDKGERVGIYNKVHLFDVHVTESNESFNESNTISAGKESVVIDTPFGKLGIAVCYDIRFPEFFRKMILSGAEIIAVPTAFTYVTGQAHWEVLLRARAIENQLYMLAACQTGVHANKRHTYGHSMIINPWGVILGCLTREEGVLIKQIDLDYLQKLRKEFPVLSHRIF